MSANQQSEAGKWEGVTGDGALETGWSGTAEATVRKRRSRERIPAEGGNTQGWKGLALLGAARRPVGENLVSRGGPLLTS